MRGARSLEPAAIPTLEFELGVDAAGQPIRSILLDVQIQIAARLREYSSEAQDRLLELFGSRDRWGTTLRTLPWVRTTAVVPAFVGHTVARLHLPASYDLEITASRYFAALEDGEIPLEFLFSGSVFFSSPEGSLQTARIGWDRELEYRLPVSVWRRAIDRHFPNSAWLRLGREQFDRLCAYKARHAFATWDDAVGALLNGEERR